MSIREYWTVTSAYSGNSEPIHSIEEANAEFERRKKDSWENGVVFLFRHELIDHFEKERYAEVSSDTGERSDSDEVPRDE